MKKILLIAIVLLLGSNFAQADGSHLIKDTVVVGNQAMIRVSMCNYTYEDSAVSLPYPTASAAEVYKAAKTTGVMEVLRNVEKLRNFSNLLLKTYDVYTYNKKTGKWKPTTKEVLSPKIDFFLFMCALILVLIVIILKHPEKFFKK